MSKPTKKSKDKKLNDLQKVDEYLQTHQMLLVVDKNDITNHDMEELKNFISNHLNQSNSNDQEQNDNLSFKILTVKQRMLMKKFPKISVSGNFFLLFLSTSNALDNIKNFQFSDFATEGLQAVEPKSISKGEVSSKKIATVLMKILKESQEASKENLQGENHQVTTGFGGFKKLPQFEEIQGTKKYLKEDFLICESEQTLTQEQCRILKAMNCKMGKKSIKILEVYECKNITN
ncbi:hypothetical protein NUSPORA_02114 [Nucleospora cyclopteri]